MAQLIETTLWEGTDFNEDGVLRNVVILGQRSKNKRVYTDTAMRSAVPLYEGAEVYDNHGKKGESRATRERYGRLRNVRFVESEKKVRGDLVYLKSQAQLTSMLKEDIERKLNFFGLSHVADGDFYMKDGVKMVTNISKVTSVDVVSGPATVTGLMEQADTIVVDMSSATDTFCESVLAVLNDESLDNAGKKAKLQTLVSSTAPVKEQTDADPVKSLTEQVASLTKTVAALQKPKKYVTAASSTATTLTEQTDATPVDAPPKDKAALKKWLRS
ncbi:hypothetical protein J8F10_14365 [Gemmata sp. G18]|uniref:Uncharacterized protein n=1 Tax=Gemmata palustris TaxID=2822762 RepID=A0ABS5BRW9_9BACT|nr:hypothetical protein [Gemmata palustris]MBP3956461.1 hypothetical protein [Gemmata palustris]